MSELNVNIFNIFPAFFFNLECLLNDSQSSEMRSERHILVEEANTKMLVCLLLILIDYLQKKVKYKNYCSPVLEFFTRGVTRCILAGTLQKTVTQKRDLHHVQA